MDKGRKSIITSPSLLVLALWLMGCASAAPPPVPTPPEGASQEAPMLVEVRDLVYATVDGKELLLDLFYQKNADTIFIYIFYHSPQIFHH